MLKFISLIVTTREDTMKNEDFIKPLQILTRNFKEEGNKTGGRRMRKIKEKGESYVFTDRLGVHKVERSFNAWVGYIQDKIHAENIIVFHIKYNFIFPHIFAITILV